MSWPSMELENGTNCPMCPQAESESCSVVSDSWHPTHGLYSTVNGILQARILQWVAFPSPGDLPKAGIEPRSPSLQEDSLPAEPLGKPKNTGVGSLSLLQQIFPTQEPNRGLLHCRWILYQMSYQGSPNFPIKMIFKTEFKATLGGLGISMYS